MRESLGIKIYKKIRDDITYGKLTPGQRFTEIELTKKYKVSRSPIREALNQLSGEGLITFNGAKYKKILVTKLSIKEVNEIYNMRLLLESYAASLFAEKATTKDVKYLEELNKNLKKAAKANNLKNWINNNTLFHDYIINRCGNSNLISTLDILKRKTYRYKYLVLTVQGHLENYLKDHEGIITGCKKNNGNLAERHMKNHLKTIHKVLIDYLNVAPMF